MVKGIRVKDFSSDIPSEYRGLITDRHCVSYATVSDAIIDARQLKSIDLDNKRITVVASDNGIDRDGEVIATGAFDRLIGSYVAAGAPVVSSHLKKLDSGMSPTAGKAVKLFTQNEPFVAVIEFIPTVIGKDHWVAYSTGAQRGISVSYLSPMGKRIDDVPTIMEAELVEMSLVVVGANPRALALGVVQSEIAKSAMGLKDTHELADIKSVVDELADQMANFTKIFGGESGTETTDKHVSDDTDAEAFSKLADIFAD